MLSTSKQKAREERSRQSDVMSDLEIVDIMLRSGSRKDEVNDQTESHNILDSESNRLQRNSNLVGEDFRSLLNTNNRENSEMTMETTRMISDKITNRVTRKLNEIKSISKSQIQHAVSTAIAEKIRPSKIRLIRKGELITS